MKTPLFTRDFGIRKYYFCFSHYVIEIYGKRNYKSIQPLENLINFQLFSRLPTLFIFTRLHISLLKFSVIWGRIYIIYNMHIKFYRNGNPVYINLPTDI